jgi:hypothetical protein
LPWGALCAPFVSVLRWRAIFGQHGRFNGLLDLPDGTLLAIDQTPFLKWAGAVRPWAFDSCGAPTSAMEEAEVTVVTPSSVVDLLRAGYRPEVHPSANV